MGTAASRVVRSSWTVMAVPRITAVARSQARTHPKSIVPQLTRGGMSQKISLLPVSRVNAKYRWPMP